MNVAFLITCLTCGCISKSDIYGNWKFLQSDSNVQKIYTRDYVLSLTPPSTNRKYPLISKHYYEVKHFGLFLRLYTSYSIDNIFNIFGYIICDHTRYWLGFIPILGFQFSYKISDAEMLVFLQENRFSRDKVIDIPISRYRFGRTEKISDHSVPPLMEKLK